MSRPQTHILLTTVKLTRYDLYRLATKDDDPRLVEEGIGPDGFVKTRHNTELLEAYPAAEAVGDFLLPITDEVYFAEYTNGGGNKPYFICRNEEFIPTSETVRRSWTEIRRVRDSKRLACVSQTPVFIQALMDGG